MFSITVFTKNRIPSRSPYRSRHFRCISRKSSSRSCKFKSSKKLQLFLLNEHRIQHTPQLKFATKETRRNLGRGNLREDFWDCNQRQGEKQPIADRRVPSNNPKTIAGRISAAVSFSFLKRGIVTYQNKQFPLTTPPLNALSVNLVSRVFHSSRFLEDERPW